MCMADHLCIILRTVAVHLLLRPSGELTDAVLEPRSQVSAQRPGLNLGMHANPEACRRRRQSGGASGPLRRRQLR